MELWFNDKIEENPSADAIRQAIDAAPDSDDKEIVLDADDGSHVEATALPEGGYKVGGCDGKNDLEIKKPMGAAEVKALFVKYMGRDPSWRSAYPWYAIEVGHSAPPRRSGPPPWALNTVIGSIMFVVIACLVLQGSDSLRQSLPFGNSDYFYIGFISLPIVVLLVVAVLAKLMEARKASTWSTASGRIVTSETTAERQRSAGGETTVKTMPLVEYEFSVAGQKWRGNRISIGEDSGGANTEATLGRYPVGAVVSVYFDPTNPKQSVLERDIPAGFGKGLLAILFIVALIGGFIYFVVTAGPALLKGQLPNAEPVTIFAACFGLLVLLFALGGWRRSRVAANWPVVRGTVLSSGFERDTSDTDSKGRSFTPAVEYRYRVNNVDYTSRQIKLGVKMSASQAYAEKVAGRYPKGSTIDVHYNPANPSDAALENPGGFHWLLLAVALGCFALAAYTAGLFK